MLSRRKTGQYHSKKPSLASLLSGLVILVVFLTSTILLIGTYDSKKQFLTETTLRLNFSNAERMSKTMDSLFRSITNSLQYNAGVLSNMDDMLAGELNIYLEHMCSSSNFFNSIAVIGATGTVQSAFPAGTARVGEQITSSTMQEALSLRKTYISAPYITPSTKRLIVLMSQPIWGTDGAYLGILIGTVYLQENNVISQIFGNNKVDDFGSYYYIVDASGHLLYHPDKQLIGNDVSSNKVVQLLKEGKSGKQQAYNTKGVELLAGYSSVPANGWGIVVVSPIKLIRDQLAGHIRTTVSISLLPFTCLLLGVVVIARRLAQPFSYLANLVSRMGREALEMPEAKLHLSREADLLTKAVSIAVANIQKQTDQLTYEAATDALTGLMNRRALEDIMTRRIASTLPFSLIILDVDKFKLVNDTYGHGSGDEVLRHVARVISSSLRPGDVCCRYGGEEFVILLPGTGLAEAYALAEEARLALEESKAPIPGKVTVSAGVAHYPYNALDRESLLEKADKALYQAKSSGRNRTIKADHSPEEGPTNP